eukprot:7391029-Prymnesium_polylepis.3
MMVSEGALVLTYFCALLIKSCDISPVVCPNYGFGETASGENGPKGADRACRQPGVAFSHHTPLLCCERRHLHIFCHLRTCVTAFAPACYGCEALSNWLRAEDFPR